MKILFVLPTLSEGGAEGFITNLACSLGRQGAEVHIFLMAGVRGSRGTILLRRLYNENIVVHGSESRKILSLMNILRLARLVQREQPAVVQANLHSAEVLVAIVRVLCWKTKTYYVRRLANTQQGSSRCQIVVRILNRMFHLTVACSGAVAEAFMQRFGARGLTNIVTIPNGGVLYPRLPQVEDRMAARQSLGIACDSFVVAHIGRMSGQALFSSQKAHDVLLKSFAVAFGCSDSCVLICVGDGPLRPQVEQLACQLGIAAQVRFLGVQEEPWPALLASDLFCFPSRHEGLPNVIPEAISCGLPIVASDIKEIVNLGIKRSVSYVKVDSVSGFANAMVAVHDDVVSHKAKAREDAVDVLRRFSMERCAVAYMRCFQQLLSKSKTRQCWRPQ